MYLSSTGCNTKGTLLFDIFMLWSPTFSESAAKLNELYVFTWNLKNKDSHIAIDMHIMTIAIFLLQFRIRFRNRCLPVTSLWWLWIGKCVVPNIRSNGNNTNEFHRSDVSRKMKRLLIWDTLRIKMQYKRTTCSEKNLFPFIQKHSAKCYRRVTNCQGACWRLIFKTNGRLLLSYIPI